MNGINLSGWNLLAFRLSDEHQRGPKTYSQTHNTHFNNQNIYPSIPPLLPSLPLLCFPCLHSTTSIPDTFGTFG